MRPCALLRPTPVTSAPSETLKTLKALKTQRRRAGTPEPVGAPAVGRLGERAQDAPLRAVEVDAGDERAP